MRARRVGHTTWANPSGANGHIRWVNEQNVVTPTADGHLWTWTHGNNGGEIVTYGPGSRWGAGSAWEVQIAYTNGQAPVAWSPARTVIVGAPREPREVALTAGPGAFRVTWLRDNSGGNTPVETGWKVQYRKSGATTWTDADISDADARSHVQTGLDSETAYEVQVAGTNARGTGTIPATPYTVTTLAGTLTSPSIPKPPRNLSATQSGNSLAVTWDAPASGDTPTAYQVRWRIGADTRRRDVAEWSTPVQVTQRTHTIAGVSGAALYEVQVASISNTLLSFPAFITWDTTLSGPTIVQVEKPVNLAATQSSNSLNVTWDAPTSGAVVTKYQIRWRTGKTKGQRAAAAWSSPVTVTGGQATGNTHTIPGISNAVFYQVEVASVTDQLITFPEFIKWEARVGGPQITTPQIPTNLTATHGNGALTLNWGPPTRGATVGTYHVRWRSGATKAARNAAAWSAPVQVENATHYAIPNIADDRTTLYQAQVASITDDLLVFTGLIHWKTTVQWPEITVPEPPQNLRATHSGDTLTLSWEAPTSGATVSGYRVRYRTGSTLALLETAGWSAPVQAIGRSQSITGISAGTLFEGQVASITPALATFPDFIEWETSLFWPSRPAGAPWLRPDPQDDGVDIVYTPPAFLGFPPATEVRVRYRRPNNGDWGNTGGEEGQARMVTPGTNDVPGFAGWLWQWSLNDAGGIIRTAGGSIFGPGNTWEIQMAYINGQTPVNWSPQRTVTVGAPGEATNVRVSGGPGAFVAQWDGSRGPATTDWQVRYRKKGEADYTSVEIAEAGARSYVQNGLEPGTEYEVLVVGTNSNGTGVLPLSPQSVTTGVTDTVTPRNLAATRGDGEVTLAWDAPSGAGPYSTYSVRFKTGADEAALTAAEYGDPAAATALTYAITVANNERYAAQVAAVNDGAPEFVSWDAAVQSAAPEFTDAAFSLPTLYVRAEPYSIEFPAATSPDSTPVNYTLGGLPANSGLTFAADTRILSGIPTAEAVAAGEATLAYAATDSAAFSVEQTIPVRFGEFDMDVDESGTVDNRDSILVARYLLGVTGAALTFG
ncbi:MAG: fibronectin type III domain-containing protein, partial [Gammaproteobacteria bacterium]|nr:fibronectin type III domain-containing protein [Gammaproteobacteria bacterium]